MENSAAPTKRYAQISDQPANAPPFFPRLVAAYPYIDPAALERRVNWFKFGATNMSIAPPNAYASHVALPAFAYL